MEDKTEEELVDSRYNLDEDYNYTCEAHDHQHDIRHSSKERVPSRILFHELKYDDRYESCQTNSRCGGMEGTQVLYDADKLIQGILWPLQIYDGTESKHGHSLLTIVNTVNAGATEEDNLLHQNDNRNSINKCTQ